MLLDLPADDGHDGDEPTTCSTAALFLRFTREFRRLHAQPGFTFEELDTLAGDGAAGQRRACSRRPLRIVLFRGAHALGVLA